MPQPQGSRSVGRQDGIVGARRVFLPSVQPSAPRTRRITKCHRPSSTQLRTAVLGISISLLISCCLNNHLVCSIAPLISLSGFEFRAPRYALSTPALSPVCARTITSGDITITAQLASHTDTMVTSTEGMIVHRAWHVSWAESDTASMSPSLPPLTSGKYLATWEPGQVIADGAYDHHNGDNSGGRGWPTVLYFAAIGAPLIFVAFITCGGWLLCRKQRKRRAHQVPINMELRAK